VLTTFYIHFSFKAKVVYKCAEVIGISKQLPGSILIFPLSYNLHFDIPSQIAPFPQIQSPLYGTTYGVLCVDREDVQQPLSCVVQK
jgi:hypothetical protein